MYTLVKKKSNKPELGLGENLVLELSKNFTKKYNCLYFDNFFTSIPLMKTLLGNDLFGCGTFRVNKKFYPKHLMKKLTLQTWRNRICPKWRYKCL